MNFIFHPQRFCGTIFFMFKFRTRWRKVMRDLWLNRTRTILVVLSIAVGVFAVGVIATTQIVLSSQLNESYMSINPSSASILTFTPFGESVIKAVEKMPEVAEADARRMVTVRLKLGEDRWQMMELTAMNDFENIKVDIVRPGIGKWPPGDNEIIIERSALKLINADVGDTVTIKDTQGKIRQMKVVGTAFDVYAQMFTMQNIAYGYITFDTLKWFGEERAFNDLRFTVAQNRTDRDHIKAVTQRVQDKLEQDKAVIWYTFVAIPGQHPMHMIIEPILAMLAVLSILALILSVFLVINMISALLTQQQKQIGMMKEVGAVTSQIVSMYFVTVLVFGLLSLGLALPLGLVGARILANGLTSRMNIDLLPFTAPLPVLGIQIGVAMIVPLVAAAYPIWRGTRVTVREAISDYGLGKGKFGTNWFDRILITIYTGFLNRPTIISLRNTFRRKARLSLTLITLVMGGAIFISVFSVQDSLALTLEAMLDYYRYDVGVQFNRPYRLQRIAREAMQIPGVEAVEGWGFTNLRRQRPDGTESDNIIVMAPPANTKLVKPTLLEGRWLIPEDENAVVINTLVLNSEIGLKVGDDMVIKINGQKRTWRIVGIALGGSVVSTMFVNYDYYAKVMRQVDKSEWTFIKTTEHTPEFRKDILTKLERKFQEADIRVGMGITVDEDMSAIQMMFAVIVYLMLVMAVLLAIVGGLGLMGTMSINVLERRREVGVMRAIGASDMAVLQIVTIEGMLIGVLSWAIAAVLAWPISKIISDMIGQQLLSTELAYRYSYGGAIFWLGLVVVLAAVSSFLPAWTASRVTVREVLAYE